MIPLTIEFRDMEPTPALDTLIRHWITKLERTYDRIERCAVVIDRPHQHHRKGQRLHVSIRLAVPGPDVVISHDHDHEDIHVAIADAFQAARRQLHDRVQRRFRDDTTSR